MRRSRALTFGALAACAYLAGVALISVAAPWSARPLLDGIAPPQPYRWASPPPNLADQNQPPLGGNLRVPLGTPRVFAFTTRDAQITLTVQSSAIPTAPGQKAATVTVEPQAPTSAPPKLRILGNVYKLSAKYAPSGKPVPSFSGNNISMTMAYPAIGSQQDIREVVFSADNSTWTKIPSSISTIQLQAHADLGAPGFYAVAGPHSTSSGLNPGLIAVIGVAGLAVFLFIGNELRALRRGK